MTEADRRPWLQDAGLTRPGPDRAGRIRSEGLGSSAVGELSASPERAAAFEGQPKRVERAHVAMVDTIIGPGG